MGSRPRNSTGRPAASLQSRKTKRAAKRTRQSRRVPQTSLIDVQDALSTVVATVDIASSALGAEDCPLGRNACQVLFEHVQQPIEKQIHVIRCPREPTAR